MGRLAVEVRLNGLLIEERCLAARRLVRIGEGEDAEICFPGADMAIMRVGEGLAVRGRLLREGQSLDIALGQVDVRVSHLAPQPAAGRGAPAMDLRLLVLTLLTIAIGTWLDALDAWLRRPETQAFAAVRLLEHGLSSAKEDQALGSHALEGRRPEAPRAAQPPSEPEPWSNRPVTAASPPEAR